MLTGKTRAKGAPEQAMKGEIALLRKTSAADPGAVSYLSKAAAAIALHDLKT